MPAMPMEIYRLQHSFRTGESLGFPTECGDLVAPSTRSPTHAQLACESIGYFRGAAATRAFDDPDDAKADPSSFRDRMPARRPIPERKRKPRIFAGGARNVSPGMGTSKEKSSWLMPPKLTLAVR